LDYGEGVGVDSSRLYDVDRLSFATTVEEKSEESPRSPHIFLHGTDTIVETGMTLFLSSVAIPIFLTGSQDPFEYSGSDAGWNLASTILMANRAYRNHDKMGGVHVSINGRAYSPQHLLKIVSMESALRVEEDVFSRLPVKSTLRKDFVPLDTPLWRVDPSNKRVSGQRQPSPYSSEVLSKCEHCMSGTHERKYETDICFKIYDGNVKATDIIDTRTSVESDIILDEKVIVCISPGDGNPRTDWVEKLAEVSNENAVIVASDTGYTSPSYGPGVFALRNGLDFGGTLTPTAINFRASKVAAMYHLVEMVSSEFVVRPRDIVTHLILSAAGYPPEARQLMDELYCRHAGDLLGPFSPPIKTAIKMSAEFLRGRPSRESIISRYFK
jgi:L-asparaginase/Glu-tRNA(Gln) amidotransferase subunit D